MSFLELKDIHKSYYVNKEEFKVLKGINLSFERGEFVSILGESGGGKTTLMNIIGGLDARYTGEVLLNGKSLRDNNEKKWDAYRRETIGFIFQNFHLISHLSILDNVMVSLEMTKLSRKEQLARAKELLEKVGLKEHIHKYPNQISGGQKQRVAIARALASDPEIIIADEPTGALDSQNTKEIMALLDDIAKDDKLVITVTHSQEVANHGTRIVHMEDGQIDQDDHIKETFPVSDNPEVLPTKRLGFGATVKMALKHMRYNLTRNILIIFGASIGIFSVLLMLGLGTGVKGYINHEIYSQVNPTSVQVAQKTNSQKPAKTEMTQSDADKFAKIKNVKNAKLGYYASGATVNYNKTNAQLQFVQTKNSTMMAKNLKKGNQPKSGEIAITKAVAKKFNKKNPNQMIGKKITFYLPGLKANNQPVTMKKSLKVSGIVADSNGPVITFNTIKSLYKENDVKFYPNFVTVKINEVGNVDKVQDKIKAYKNSDNKGKAQYQITGVGSIVDTLNTYIQLAVYVLAGIAGISLLVSAIMIIVVLYISVTERTKEIGILRALGVRKGDIRNLFISEAFFLGLFSSILALIFGYLAQWGINAISDSAINYSLVGITAGYATFGIVISVVISLLAALAPSRRAAKMDPIEALSYE